MSLKPLRDAVKAALDADAAHARLSNAVYVGWPESGASEPYTVIGAGTELPAHTHDADGWDDTLTLHDWVLARDEARLAELLARKDAVLQRQQLTVTGFGTIGLRREFMEIMDDNQEGSLRRHMVTRWRTESYAT